MPVPYDNMHTGLPIVLRKQSQILDTTHKHPTSGWAQSPSFISCHSSLSTTFSTAFAQVVSLAWNTTFLPLTFPWLIWTLSSSLNLKATFSAGDPQVLGYMPLTDTKFMCLLTSLPTSLRKSFFFK